MAVSLGGAAGALARYLLTALTVVLWGANFPWATLLVNVLGSLLLGLLVGVSSTDWPSPELRAFLAVGVLGAFTTFSTFSLDLHTLLAAGRWIAAAGYAVVSVLLGLAFLAAGHALGSLIAR